MQKQNSGRVPELESKPLLMSSTQMRCIKLSDHLEQVLIVCSPEM